MITSVNTARGDNKLLAEDNTTIGSLLGDSNKLTDEHSRVQIGFRVPKTLKNKFVEECEKRQLNQNAVLLQLLENWITSTVEDKEYRLLIIERKIESVQRWLAKEGYDSRLSGLQVVSNNITNIVSPPANTLITEDNTEEDNNLITNADNAVSVFVIEDNTKLTDDNTGGVNTEIATVVSFPVIRLLAEDNTTEVNIKITDDNSRENKPQDILPIYQDNKSPLVENEPIVKPSSMIVEEIKPAKKSLRANKSKN